MGKGITFLIAEDVNLLRRTFLVGKMSKFLAVGWYSPLGMASGSHEDLGRKF